MGKRSRQEKRRAAFLKDIREGVPGGLMGAIHRGANGSLTPSDVSFIARVRREQQGKDGYTGAVKGDKGTKGSSGSFRTGGPSYNSKGQYSFNITPLKEDGVFHCAEANEVTAECPLKPAVPSILIDAQMWGCLMAATKEYDTEWIALLIGRLDKDSKNEPAYVIERFYFPPQTASGTHVDVPTGIKPKVGTIGAIHSHVGMGVFFSSTDKDHSNWPVEVVINRKEEYEAVSRHKLKCGEWAKSKTIVYLTGSALPKAIKGQMDAAFTAGKAIASKGKVDTTAGVHPEDRGYTPSYTPSYSHYGGYGQGEDWDWRGYIYSKACAKCNHSSHVKGATCAALNCTCTTYVAPEEEVCPTSNCIREKGHTGYHRNGRNEYFQFGLGEDKEPKVEDKVAEQKQLPLTVPSDDPTDMSAALTASLEEYCERCEGEGMVEGFDTETGVWTATTCEACHGDGLSDLGRVRKAENKGVAHKGDC